MTPNTKIVNYIDATPVDHLAPISNTYVIKGGGLRGLLLRFMLHRNWATHYERSWKTYKKIELHYDKIFDLIHHLVSDVYRRTGTYPTTAILGADALYKLDTEINHTMRIPVDIPYYDPLKKLSVLGLELILNPYIDGVVVF